jgi:hypothetical protein
MGRRAVHAYGTAPDFELERCPLDAGYDAGGAYWGAPDNLWCAEGMLDGEVVVHYFVRADDRAAAMAAVLADYPGATFQYETGALIEQMVEHLQEYRDRCRAYDPQEDLCDVESEIEALQQDLDDIERDRKACESGMHSWVGEIGKLPGDTPCSHCGTLYGNPD